MTTKSGPWRITFDTNPDDCNLSCIMCEDHSPFSKTREERVNARLPRRRMDIGLIRKILESSQGSALREIIPSTMGEPLVYKQFDEIIDLCHEFKVKLNLTTNGTFPIKGAKAWAERIVPVASDVKISWNGATKQTQESIMLGSKWEKVLSNLQTFIAIRNEHAATTGHYCTVTLQLTFLEKNVDELDQIVLLGINYGVDRIKGHHLWAHFDEIKDLAMRRNQDSVARWNNAVAKAQKVAISKPLANGKYIKLDNIFSLDENANKELLADGICPFLGQEAWIATDGRFNPCCAPEKERRQLGDFGNLTNTTLAEIWDGKQYKTLCENYMQNKLCKTCNMRKSPHTCTTKI